MMQVLGKGVSFQCKACQSTGTSDLNYWLDTSHRDDWLCLGEGGLCLKPCDKLKPCPKVFLLCAKCFLARIKPLMKMK